MTTDNSKLTEKIKMEILKSGFPLEVKCRQTLSHKNWWTASSHIYFDGFDKVEREIDSIAVKESDTHKNNKRYVLFSYLILECKKNESNHWVFFNEGLGIKRLNAQSSIDDKDKKILLGLQDNKLSSHHYLHLDNTTCYCLAFKKERNQIFEAINQVSYAYRYAFLGISTGMDKITTGSVPWVNVFYPVIVIDSKLFAANFKNNDLNVEEVKKVLFVVNQRSLISDSPISIDIITADSFSDYLDTLDDDNKAILSYLSSLNT